MTTTVADQIDLPRHLKDRQILDLPWRGWRALPPAEVTSNLFGGALGGRRGGRPGWEPWGTAGGVQEAGGALAALGLGQRKIA